MKFSLLLVSLIILSGKIHAACELSPGEIIKVGCTTKCSFLYRWRLQMTAKSLGLPIEISDLNAQSAPLTAMTEVDAILAPGGADINPEYYLPNVSQELRDYTEKNLHLVKFTEEGAQRDPVEYEILSRYNEDEKFKNVPLLGICRGMQMMTVVQGIPLWLDIKTEVGIKNRRNRFDRIYLNDQDSLIQNIYKNDNFLGFKLHHQGLRLPYYEANKSKYPNVRVSALSNKEKIAEAIEYLHRPALGVQYHPEKSFTNTTFPVFKWFLTKACEYRKSR